MTHGIVYRRLLVTITVLCLALFALWQLSPSLLVREDGESLAINIRTPSSEFKSNPPGATKTTEEQGKGIGSQKLFFLPRSHCDYIASGGTWSQQPSTADGESIRYWTPHRGVPVAELLEAGYDGGRLVHKELGKQYRRRTGGIMKDDRNSSHGECPPWRRFSLMDAWHCLAGRTILLVGNSNTRVLLTALDALLHFNVTTSVTAQQMGIPGSTDIVPPKEGHEGVAVVPSGVMMSRLRAKEMCNNNRYNHSCWLTLDGPPVPVNHIDKQKPRPPTISTPTQDVLEQVPDTVLRDRGTVPRRLHLPATSYAPVHLHYVGYTKGLYDAELETRVGNLLYPPHKRGSGCGKGPEHRLVTPHGADLVVMNTGLNIIGVQYEPQWFGDHQQNAPLLERFIRNFTEDCSHDEPTEARHTTFMWHTTTPLCPPQPHFRRYKYEPRYWKQRPLGGTNRCLDKSNQYIIRTVLAPLQARGLKRKDSNQRKQSAVQVLHDFALLDPYAVTEYEGSQLPQSNGEEDLCRLYDDPLHHRFLDRELVQVMLNQYCDGF